MWSSEADGGEIFLDWVEPDPEHGPKWAEGIRPTLVLLHGLTGGSQER
jgi:predicted alpha/beta-fold hydrolase